MFIGLVSALADAQIWKTQKLAKQAIEQYYANSILQQLDETEAVQVSIKRLEQSGDNELKMEVVETLHFYREQP
jgi:RNA-binding protein YhbY